jgi:hypothetical protein
MTSTITIQTVVDYCRIFPVLTSVLGNAVAGYGGSTPVLTIANEVISEILQPPFAWKWNRAVAPSFIVNGLQQDYSTSVTDLAWLENSTRLDINSPTTPKPIRGVEVVRELLPTNTQSTPSQLSWVYNSQAICGTWTGNTTYLNGIGMNSCPMQLFTQIRDTNGNIQVVTGFGTTGSSQPTWATTPGQTTTDGTVTWTCIDPNGITFRVSPLPPQNGTVWQIQPYYQKKPKLITSISQTWSSIPDELAYVYRQGFLAKAFKAADDNRYLKEYEVFQLMIQKALGSSDRECEEFGVYPSDGLMGDPSSPSGNGWPFGWF